MASKHPGSIMRQGKDAWRVALRVNGRQYWFGPRGRNGQKGEAALRGTSKNEVIEWAWRKYHELKEQAKREADDLPVGWTMKRLLDEYENEVIPGLAENTRKTYLRGVQRQRTYFVELLGNLPVDRVRKGHVVKYLNWRKTNDKVGPRTLAKDRTELHSLFSYAEELELREGNPVTKVRAPKSDKRQPVILTPEQYERLIEECDHDPMLRVYALMLGETGGRCDSEVLKLRWEDLHLDDGFIEIVSGRDGKRTKSGKSRWVPITPRLKTALAEHALKFRAKRYDGRTSEWVFHHLRARRHASAGQRIGVMRGAFKNAAARAKLPADLHQHDLRHRRVTTWIAEGRDVTLVKEAMGHSDLRTTMGYTHLAREHLRKLVEPQAERKANSVTA